MKKKLSSIEILKRISAGTCINAETGCHEWVKCLSTTGYGRLWDGEETHYVHRLRWRAETGAIPEGLEVCHVCDNPACNNIKHLFLGTHEENMRDMAAKGHIGAYTKPEKVARGERAGGARLNEEEVQLIREIYAAGSTPQRPLAKQFNVSQSTIWQVVTYKTWRSGI